MKKALLFICLLCFIIKLNANDKKREVDSLKKVIELALEDTTKAKALNKLAWKYMFSNPDTAMVIAEEAIRVSKKSGNLKLLANAFNEKGTAYGVKGILDSAKVYFIKSHTIAKKLNDAKLLSVAFNNLGLIYWNQGQLDTAIQVYSQALDQFERQGAPSMDMANTYNNLGLIHKNRGDFDEAIQNYEQALFIFDSLQTKNRGVANAINNLGIVYYEKGDLPNAMDHYLKALKMYESLEDESDGYANVLSNIGNIYREQKDYNKALEYFNRSKEALEKISKQSVALANTLNNIGSVYRQQEKNDQAIRFFKQALEMQESMGEQTNGMTVSLSNLGNIYESEKNYEQAEAYFNQALMIQKEIGDRKGIANSLFYLGTLNIEKEQFKEAIDKCKESFEISKSLGLLETRRNACECLAESYEKVGNTSEAYRYYKLFIESRDSLINKENTREITQKAMQYEFDKIQYQDSLSRAEEAKRRELEQREKDLKKEAEIQRQRVYTVAGGVGFILMLGLAFVLFRGYKNKQKANEIISKQKEEVEHQKDAVEQQKEIIEEKNREIVDSISYAKRIQNTILPSEQNMSRLLPHSFVFFRPKDIVSGDFYWVDYRGDYTFFAAVDCTGHGVPGALVSVVGHNGLNRVLNEFNIIEPAAMLDKLNELVEATFSKSKDSIKDGMDLAICRLNSKTMELQYAGANNPLYLIRKGEKGSLEKIADRSVESENKTTLYEIKADKQPIGKFDFRKPFTNQTVELKKDDTIYIFSDGFADQFGGEKGKKFMYKPFKRLLAEIADNPMKKQRQKLADAFDNWKGELEQIDDVVVMGVKV